MFAILLSIRKRRVMNRNYRVLSALDDETLHDIGLERRSLRAFCENGCTHQAPPMSRLRLSLAGVWPEPLRPTIR